MSLSSRTEIYKPSLFSERGMVVAQNAHAARVGADILAAGGSAADAAVAVSFVLGVVEPWMSGIGGGGAALFRDAASGVVHSIDFSLRAPRLIPVGKRHPVAVPGTIAGMAALHARFGRMPWAQLIAPAIAEARAGLMLDWHSALVLSTSAARLAADPVMAAQLLPGGLPPSVGDLAASRRLSTEKLADTLQVVAEGGADAFYRGDIAVTLAGEIAGLGGSIDRADLAAMSGRIEAAETVRFRHAEVFVSPGLTYGRMLDHVLSRLADNAGAGTRMRDWYVALAQAFDTAPAEDDEWHGDPHGGASHLATADAAGNLCSVSQTLRSVFGSAVMTPETGIILNDGLLSFDAECVSPGAAAWGGACPLAACPVIVGNGEHFTAIGGAGGGGMLSALAQVVGFLVDHGMTLEEAIHQPRVECVSDAIIVHPALADLLADGFPARRTISLPHRVWPPAYSIVNALAVEPDGAIGCADPISPAADAAAPDG